MGLTVNVEIQSANNIGGVFPFIVVCFDNDLPNELHKTPATTGGPTAVFNDTFQVDLTTQIKNIVADGKPEPQYLTFFIFDTGAPGVPSLGSAGVLLSTVVETGEARGDFPVVNGSGTIALVVEKEGRKGGFLSTTGGKVAVTAGVIGAAGLAAGLGMMAINNQKKKKGGKKKKKKKTSAIGSRGGIDLNADDDDDDDDDDDEDEEDGSGEEGGVRTRALEDGDEDNEQGASGAAAETQAAHAATHAAAASASKRPWWDPETDDDDEPSSTGGTTQA